MESTIKNRDGNGFKKNLAFQNTDFETLFFHYIIHLMNDERHQFLGEHEDNEYLSGLSIGQQESAHQTQ